MKDKKTAALLAIFLGSFGIHKFYLGQHLYGCVFLLLLLLFPLGALISLFQGVIWLSQDDETFNKNHPNSKMNFTQETVETSSSLISDSINKTKKFVQKRISKSYLVNCTWSLFLENDINQSIQYIFRENNELLISINGIINRKKYELIIDNNSILITDNEVTELYNIVVVETDFLFLNKVSSNQILKFYNQTKLKDELKENLKQRIQKINYSN